jgi:hypothetical protein
VEDPGKAATAIGFKLLLKSIDALPFMQLLHLPKLMRMGLFSALPIMMGISSSKAFNAWQRLD